MEADSLYPFNGECKKELSFPEKVVINVLDMSHENWYKAEYEGVIGYIPSNHIQMKDHSWFVGKVSRAAATERLMSTGKNGTFCVRVSESVPGFSLSVKFNDKVQHLRIFRTDDGQYYLWKISFPSLNKLLTYYHSNSVSQSVADLRLTEPMVSDAKPEPMSAAGAPTNLVATPQSAGAADGKAIRLRAKFKFVPEEEEELSFEKGDIITVLAKEEENWWRGSCNGREGVFPHSYCEPV